MVYDVVPERSRGKEFPLAEKSSCAFLSYSREDSEFAVRLAGDLKAAGVVVWRDRPDIDPGRRWDDAVQDALTSCPCMLVILSPASVASTTVMDEVSLVLEQKKTVIPVLYRDCKIHFRLRRVQYVDFRNDYDQGLKDLLKTLLSVEQRAEPGQPDVSQAGEQGISAEDARQDSPARENIPV